MEARKAYIVTGSASGVGAATALALARRGAGVVINYTKSAHEAQDVAAQCRAAGGDAVVVQADVAQDEACVRLAAAATARWGRIDGLVNNAGTTRFVSARKLDGLSAEDFQHIYGVNLIGAFQMVRACAPALRETRGAVVNVSSTAGLFGSGSSIAYCCSKGALNTLTLSLARALGPEIRVNAVLPGFIETRWLQQGLGADNYARAEAAYRAQSALGEVLTPDDVAEAVLHLLDAKKMTGELVKLDAGKEIGKLP